MTPDTEARFETALAEIAASSVKVGQTYKHFKTGTVYTVTGLGCYEASLEPLVDYRSEFDPPGFTWKRHLAMFNGEVIVGDQVVKRFQLVVL